MSTKKRPIATWQPVPNVRGVRHTQHHTRNAIGRLVRHFSQAVAAFEAMKLPLAAALLLAMACLARPAFAAVDYTGLTIDGYTFGSDVGGECAQARVGKWADLAISHIPTLRQLPTTGARRAVWRTSPLLFCCQASAVSAAILRMCGLRLCGGCCHAVRARAASARKPVPLGSPACSSALHLHALLSRLVEALALQTTLTHSLATAMAWDHILNPAIMGSPPSTAPLVVLLCRVW